jgi:hypothetical protein
MIEGVNLPRCMVSVYGDATVKPPVQLIYAKKDV